MKLHKTHNSQTAHARMNLNFTIWSDSRRIKQFEPFKLCKNNI